MKKTGFTLAEVLITLTIIGVVAMMTLPALMTNVQEQQAKTGLKKGINTLTEAAQMSQAISGFDYGSLRADLNAIDGDSQDTQTMTGILLSRTSVDLGKSNWGGETAASNIMLDAGRGSAAVRAMQGPRIVFFRDGSAIAYRTGDTQTNQNPGQGNTAMCNDGLPLGFTLIYDINGEKAPNMLSNCDGVTDANADGGASVGGVTVAMLNDGFDTRACEQNRANRNIKDQFLLQARRGSITPVGAAATWAVSN